MQKYQLIMEFLDDNIKEGNSKFELCQKLVEILNDKFSHGWSCLYGNDSFSHSCLSSD
jgi:hypothetical protein